MAVRFRFDPKDRWKRVKLRERSISALIGSKNIYKIVSCVLNSCFLVAKEILHLFYNFHISELIKMFKTLIIFIISINFQVEPLRCPYTWINIKKYYYYYLKCSEPFVELTLKWYTCLKYFQMLLVVQNDRATTKNNLWTVHRYCSRWELRMRLSLRFYSLSFIGVRKILSRSFDSYLIDVRFEGYVKIIMLIF